MSDRKTITGAAALVVVWLIILGVSLLFVGALTGIWTSESMGLPEQLMATGVCVLGAAAVGGFVWSIP